MLDREQSFAVVPQEELVHVEPKTLPPSLQYWNMLDQLGCTPMKVETTESTATSSSDEQSSGEEEVKTVVKNKVFTIRATLDKEQDSLPVGDARCLDVSVKVLYDDREMSEVPDNASNEAPVTFTSQAVDKRTIVMSVKLNVLSSKKENMNFRLAVYGAERTSQGMGPRQRLCTAGPFKVVSKIRKKAYVTKTKPAKSVVGQKTSDDVLGCHLLHIQQTQSRQQATLERICRAQAAQQRALQCTISATGVEAALQKLLDAFSALPSSHRSTAVGRASARHHVSCQLVHDMDSAMADRADDGWSEPGSESDSGPDRVPSPEEVMLEEVWSQLNWPA